MIWVRRVVCGVVALSLILFGGYLTSSDTQVIQALGFCLFVAGITLMYIAITQRMPNYNYWVTLVAIALGVALFMPKDFVENDVDNTDITERKTAVHKDNEKSKLAFSLDKYPKISGSIDVVHANVFYISGRRVRLYGVDAPDNDQICSNASGGSYNCGQEAVSWIRGWIDNNQIDCYLLQINPNGEDIATCVWGEYDIGAGLVGAGWALANTNETRIYAPYEAKAQGNSYGLWSGTFYSPQDWRDIKNERNNFKIQRKSRGNWLNFNTLF
ncbi:MAG: thermonuclease family protein [Alphaproteobacteria bacterium]|nr:thermonuclease family protein [Alphaproteobacteria bacterium]